MMTRGDAIRWAQLEQRKAEQACRGWAAERDRLKAVLAQPGGRSAFALNSLMQRLRGAILECDRAHARIGSAKARQRELGA